MRGTNTISRRSAMAAGTLLLLTLSTPVANAAEIRPGKPAPDFTVLDSKGKTVRLSDFKGKTVVLEWTNQDCPYVRKHYETGNMQALQKEAAAGGVVWLTVSSSAPGLQGHVNGLEADALTQQRKAAPAAFLLDPAGTVGRLFEARTTPHLYVVDGAGLLAYVGAIDDRPSANQGDVKGARNYVREALAALAVGKPVPVASTRAYGCSVKYGPVRS